MLVAGLRLTCLARLQPSETVNRIHHQRRDAQPGARTDCARMANNSSFWELYKHPFWQKKRLEVMERESFQCEECKSKNETLNVHHSYYVRGRKPWEYPSEHLHCLCDECHEMITGLLLQIRQIMGPMRAHDLRKLVSILKLNPPELQDSVRYPDLAFGQVVEHPRYGIGTVVGFRGGEQPTVTIQFQLHGVKTFDRRKLELKYEALDRQKLLAGLASANHDEALAIFRQLQGRG